MYRTWSQWAPLPLRLVLGTGLMVHGFPKVFSGEGRAQFVGMLQGLGIPLPGLNAWLVGFIEFFGGLAILIGAFTAVAAGLNVLVQLVALFTVHLGNGFSFMNVTGMGESGPTFGMPGWEVNFLYIGALVALILGGAGALSADKARADRRASVAPTPAHA